MVKVKIKAICHIIKIQFSYTCSYENKINLIITCALSVLSKKEIKKLKVFEKVIASDFCHRVLCSKSVMHYMSWVNLILYRIDLLLSYAHR